LTRTADRISVRELQDLLTAGDPVTVVDIRTLADHEWWIPGSVHVGAYEAVKSGTLGLLANRDFSTGPVVTVCESGNAAAKATALLRATGVQAATLEGGMRAWSLAWNMAEATISGSAIVQVRRTGKGCLSYVVESDTEAIVIDASLDPGVYVQLIRNRGWRLKAVMDTHIHADHLSRSRLLAQQEHVDLFLPSEARTHYPYRALADGDKLPFGSAELVALATPGHTAESTTYVFGNAAAFTGDTLFLAGVGRPDLEGGTADELASRARLLHGSIGRILDLPDKVLVLPGHVSDPISFDGRLLATTVNEIRNTVALTKLGPDAFVEAVLARIPPNPPNHSVIVGLNERGELPADPSELEAGANRCAVA
jgi:glyoxylase-like metal-dependent hydrolase (beta-lactamase superfamily II)